MPSSTALKSEIQGWGADLDPSRRGGVPREKTPPFGTGAHWDEPERQIPRIKVLVSTEHRGLTPVFGTACPPRGISGKIRELAFKYSEGQKSHWLLLLLADRVDVIEGLVEDLSRGKIPNFFSEMGLRREFTRSGLKSRFIENRADKKRWTAQAAGLATIGVAAFLVARAFRDRRGTESNGVALDPVAAAKRFAGAPEN